LRAVLIVNNIKQNFFQMQALLGSYFRLIHSGICFIYISCRLTLIKNILYFFDIIFIIIIYNIIYFIILFIIYIGGKWTVEENGISFLEENGYGHIIIITNNQWCAHPFGIKSLWIEQSKLVDIINKQGNKLDSFELIFTVFNLL